MARTSWLDERLCESRMIKPELSSPVVHRCNLVVSLVKVQRQNERGVSIDVGLDPGDKGSQENRITVRYLSGIPCLGAFSPIENDTRDEDRIVEVLLGEGGCRLSDLVDLLPPSPLRIDGIPARELGLERS